MKVLFFLFLSIPSFLFAEGWNWKMGISKGNLATQSPTDRMFKRAVRDAWEEESTFFPELYYGKYLYPKNTFLQYESYSIKGNLEYKFSLAHRFFLGLDYFQMSLSSGSNQSLTRRRMVSLFFTKDLSLENAVRGSAYIANSYRELSSFYTSNVGYRYIVPMDLYFLYGKAQMGAGSCVRGPTCNIARGEIGIGIEQEIGLNIRWYGEFYVSHFTQAQELIRFQGVEKGIGFGIVIGN